MNFRFSLSSLFIFVTCVATAAACLTTMTSKLADEILVSLTVFALLLSIALAFFGRNKPFWAGFAICGWGYIALAFCGPEDLRHGLTNGFLVADLYRSFGFRPMWSVDVFNRIGIAVVTLVSASAGGAATWRLAEFRDG